MSFWSWIFESCTLKFGYVKCLSFMFTVSVTSNYRKSLSHNYILLDAIPVVGETIPSATVSYNSYNILAPRFRVINFLSGPTKWLFNKCRCYIMTSSTPMWYVNYLGQRVILHIGRRRSGYKMAFYCIPGLSTRIVSDKLRLKTTLDKFDKG